MDNIPFPISCGSASTNRTVAADKASEPKDKATSSKVSSSSKQKVSHATWNYYEECLKVTA